MFKQIVSLFLLLNLTFVSAASQEGNNTKAWKATNINEAALALYGQKKFARIKKSLYIEMITPKGIVQDSEVIPVRIRTSIPAKSIAIFQDANPYALVAIFHTNTFEASDLEIPIRLERKGTVFAVIESMSGVLYYARAYVDVLCLPCMATGK